MTEWLHFHFSFSCIGEVNGSPLQCSCLENPRDGGAWWAAVHWVAKSWTRPSDFTFTFHFHALEKKMATHFSVLAWRIPGTGEPGGLPSIGSHRIRHDWSDLAAAAAAQQYSYGKYFTSNVPQYILRNQIFLTEAFGDHWTVFPKAVTLGLQYYGEISIID